MMKHITKIGHDPRLTEIHTNNPDLTIPNTSESLVNNVANDPKDTPNMIAKEMPVNSPVWGNIYDVIKNNPKGRNGKKKHILSIAKYVLKLKQ